MIYWFDVSLSFSTLPFHQCLMIFLILLVTSFILKIIWREISISLQVAGELQTECYLNHRAIYVFKETHILKKNVASIKTVMATHFKILPEIKRPCRFSSNLNAHPCFLLTHCSNYVISNFCIFTNFHVRASGNYYSIAFMDITFHVKKKRHTENIPWKIHSVMTFLVTMHELW